MTGTLKNSCNFRQRVDQSAALQSLSGKRLLPAPTVGCSGWEGLSVMAYRLDKTLHSNTT